MDLLIQLLANGLVNGAIYSLLAVGFGLVYRTTKTFHIAYGILYTLAAYYLYSFFKILSLPLSFSLLLALSLLLFSGLLIEMGVYRPLFIKQAKSGAVLIASLGVNIFIENLIALVFGNETKILSSGIEPTFTLGSIILTRIQIIQFFTGVVLVFLFYIVIKRSRILKALWVMGDNPDLIRAIGLSIFKLRTLVFISSTFFVGIAGALIALDVGMDPHIGFPVVLTSAVAVIVGGVDSYIGWVLGSFLLAELQSLVIWKASARWTPLITFLLLILILLTRPQGLFGTKKRFEEV